MEIEAVYVPVANQNDTKMRIKHLTEEFNKVNDTYQHRKLELQPRLDEAMHNARMVSNADISEVTGYLKPPNTVKLLSKVLMILLSNNKPGGYQKSSCAQKFDWAEFKSHDQKTLLRDLMAFDKDLTEDKFTIS